MKFMNLKRFPPVVLAVFVCIAVFGGLFAYSYVRIGLLEDRVERIAADLSFATTALSSKAYDLSRTIVDLKQKATGFSDELSSTKQNIKTVETRVGGVAQTVGKISGTVDTLEKLSKTDPELLQKYSKVYFLNEHYVPERITEIPVDYCYSGRRRELVHASVWPHLKKLLDSAGAAGEKLYVKSAYRSFDEQQSLKASYTVVYGAGTANQFSADQGYSEHQLGTTVDFITTGLGGELYGFEKTVAYDWLVKNAYRYGFTLSYPEGNAYYIFEPWHWRYVGVELATFLHKNNKHFYDLDQREIDEYLVEIFD